MSTSTTQKDVPKSVQELSSAAHAVYDAQQVDPGRRLSVRIADMLITTQAMQNNKDKWGKVTKVVREIDTCVSNTAKTAYHRGEGVGQPVVVVAALGATGECVCRIMPFTAADLVKCATRMREIYD